MEEEVAQKLGVSSWSLYAMDDAMVELESVERDRRTER